MFSKSNLGRQAEVFKQHISLWEPQKQTSNLSDRTEDKHYSNSLHLRAELLWVHQKITLPRDHDLLHPIKG